MSDEKKDPERTTQHLPHIVKAAQDPDGTMRFTAALPAGHHFIGADFNLRMSEPVVVDEAPITSAKEFRDALGKRAAGPVLNGATSVFVGTVGGIAVYSNPSIPRGFVCSSEDGVAALRRWLHAQPDVEIIKSVDDGSLPDV